MTIIVGDCREILDTLPEQSVQCVVTSPPYWGQRDYGVDGMIGLEDDVSEWVDVMVEVFQKVWRVLRDDGTLWLNLGDKYAGSGGAGGDYNEGGLKEGVEGGPAPSQKQSGFKAKDLMGLPWRVAFALQADGWYLRRDIIWHKPNPMPESATDRPATAHEYIFLLTKKPRYFYDQDAVKTPVTGTAHARGHGVNPKAQQWPDGWATGDDHSVIAHSRRDRTPKPRQNASFSAAVNELVESANLRSVWTIPTQAFSGPHYATYPEKLVEPCIKAGTSERGECPECGAPWKRVTELVERHINGGAPGVPKESRGAFKQGTSHSDREGLTQSTHETTGWQPTCDHAGEPVPQTILDPFSGAGTTGLVAARFGRRYIGIELNPEYAEMSRKRIADRVGVRTPEDAPTDQPTQATFL